MVSRGWTLSGEEYRYIPLTSGEAGTYSYSTVTRPDSAGEGGGDERQHNLFTDLFHAYGSDHAEFVAQFESVREAIDAAVAPFRDLPDPAALDEFIVLSRETEAGLWLSPDVGTGGLDLAAHIASVKNNMASLSGAFPQAFEAQFVNQLEGTIGALRELAIVRYAALAQEKELWTLAREQIMEAIDQTTAQMELAAQKKGADLSLVLQIAGYVAAGAAIAVSGGTAAVAAVGVASLGITILSETAVADDQKEEATDASYESLTTTFAAFADRLREDVTTAEQEITDNAAANIAGVDANRTTYEVHSDAGAPAAYNEVTVDVPAAKEISQGFLPAASGLLRDLMTRHGHMYVAPALRHTGDIGSRQSGAATELAEISTMLYLLVEKLATEIDRAAGALEEWVDDLDNHETSVREQLQEFQDLLDQSTRFDLPLR